VEKKTWGRVILFNLESRVFTLYDLKRSLLAASDGLDSSYLTVWDLDLWEIVEIVEIMVELRNA
jgi:hypothetical protein